MKTKKIKKKVFIAKSSLPDYVRFICLEKLNFCEDLFFFFFFFIFGDRIFVKTFSFFFFFGEHLRFVSLVLGLCLEHSCPWPRECLSSERLSLALASDFFCVLGLGLGLEPCVLDSTSGGYLFLGKSLLVVLLQKFTLACEAQAVIWGDTARNAIPHAQA